MGEQEYDKEQLRILRNAFKAFDQENEGFIDTSNVQTILEMLGQKLEDKAIKNLIQEQDKAKTGKLNFSQFCALAARFVEVEEDAEAVARELKEAFRVYDKEGKGYLTVKVLRDILHELDDKLSNNELDMIIEEIDADGSGTVDFDEFMTVMQGKNCFELTLTRRVSYNFPSRRRCVVAHFHRWNPSFLDFFSYPDFNPIFPHNYRDWLRFMIFYQGFPSRMPKRKAHMIMYSHCSYD